LGNPSLILHSGAGSGKFASGDVRFRELKEAWEEGNSALRRGSSLDGVVAAVRRMEESGAFNAGRGACLAADGSVQLDAAVMMGEGRRGAGVGVCTCTSHPVSLARAVMELTEHVLVVGEECEDIARAAGIKTEKLAPSQRSLAKFAELKGLLGKTHPKNASFLRRISEDGNTVGAVAVDSGGVPAAAVSTGGVWMKLPGRVGDSAIIGAGIYAEPGVGAACATGTGEEIIRAALCWNACEFMRKGEAAAAARKAITLISRRSGRGTAGLVTADAGGRVGFAYNTEAMGRAWFDKRRDRLVVQS
jgi:L-asparaginase / beta-aspartyl-peptidase